MACGDRGERVRAMAWLGNFTVSDFAGAVTKLSESVKNIEKNFDSALGFESSESASRDGNALCFFISS